MDWPIVKFPVQFIMGSNPFNIVCLAVSWSVLQTSGYQTNISFTVRLSKVSIRGTHLSIVCWLLIQNNESYFVFQTFFLFDVVSKYILLLFFLVLYQFKMMLSEQTLLTGFFTTVQVNWLYRNFRDNVHCMTIYLSCKMAHTQFQPIFRAEDILSLNQQPIRQCSGLCFMVSSE